MDSEKAKKKAADGDVASPIPFYLVDAFAEYECSHRDKKLISANLSTQAQVKKLLRIYTAACKQYAKRFMQAHNLDYTKMIKADIDYHLFAEVRENVLDMLASFE